MSVIAPIASASSKRISRFIAFRLLWIGLGMMVLAGVSALCWWSFFGAASAVDAAPDKFARNEIASADVLMSESQERAAGIHCTPLVKRTIHPLRSIPATVQYDPARRVDIIAPVDGVVTKVLMVAGQAIRTGEPLATMSGEQIGLARNELLTSEAELGAAKRAAEWHRHIEMHLMQLLDRLTEHPEVKVIEQEFAERELGDYRGDVLGAYAKLRLAEALVGNADALSANGIVTVRNAAQRNGDLQVARAEFVGTCEESRFACAQAMAASQKQLDQAERLVRVRKERLMALEGSTAALDANPVQASIQLNELMIRAPWNANVTHVDVATNSRVVAGQRIAELVDASRLWIAAAIHERDLAGVSVQGGEPMAISFSAFPDEHFTATAKHLDARMDAETRSVSLIAEMENPTGRLRPGMFAWIQLPNAAPRDAIVAPQSALLRHDGRTFVFVRMSNGRFRRVEVSSGWEDGSSVELAGEIETGQEVVDQGAFVLKSMLLLEQEAE